MKTKILCLILAIGIFVITHSASAYTLNPRTGALEGGPNYKVAALMVTFTDHPDKPLISQTAGPWTKSYLNGYLFTNADSMAAYYADASDGRISVSGDVYDNNGQWYSVTRPVLDRDTCNWNTYFPAIIAAADADIDFSQYDTIMIFTPQVACSTGGFAGSVRVPDAGNLLYRMADVDGYLGSVPHHELGHIIGMAHANSWTCDAPGVLTGTNCQLEEYGDRFDVMGVSSRMLQPSAPHKEALGWLAASEITTVTASGDYTIANYEAAGTAAKVLKIPQARDLFGNVTNWYYLEYRQPVGFDYMLRKPTIEELGVPYGVLVHVGSGVPGYITTTLLDMTPGSLPGQDEFDPALPLGSSYSDATAGVSFGVLSRTSNDMTIRVSLDPATLCRWAAPTVTAKALKSSGRPGQELKYEVVVKNNATLCGRQKFDLKATKKPKGWTVTIGQAVKKTTTLLPGQSVKYYIRIKSPRNAKYNKYPVQITVTPQQNQALKKIKPLKPVLKR
jgi:M6 family metalloprotease-like protein